MTSFTGSVTNNRPVQKDGGSSKGGKKYFLREKSNVLKSIQIAVKCVTIDWRCQTAKILFAFQRPPSPTKSAHTARWRSANKNILSRNPNPPNTYYRAILTIAFLDFLRCSKEMKVSACIHLAMVIFTWRNQCSSVGGLVNSVWLLIYNTWQWPPGQILATEILWISPFLKFLSLQ